MFSSLQSFRISLIFIVCTTALQVVLGFFYGYLVYLQPKGYRFFKTMLFLPTILPSVATGFVWCYIYSPSMGILKPFSFVLENDEKEILAELYLADDDTVIISGELMEGLDQELDNFLEKLMEDEE